MITFDEIKMPKSGQKPEVYAEFLLSLHSCGQFWDRGKGHISYLQGRALLMAREACKKPGAWGAFLKSVRMTPSTAKHLRRIAHEFSEQQAMQLGYSEMLTRIYPSYKTQLQEDVDKEDSKKPPRPTGGNEDGDTGPAPSSFTVLVKDLSDMTADIESAKDRFPTKMPDNADLQSIGEARRVLQIIVNEGSALLKRVMEWQGKLTGRRAA